MLSSGLEGLPLVLIVLLSGVSSPAVEGGDGGAVDTDILDACCRGEGGEEWRGLSTALRR